MAGHRREVMQSLCLSVAFSPDGKSLASSSFDGDIFLWNVVTAKSIRQLSSPDRVGRNVIAITYAPNGKMVATAEASSAKGATITLWETATGQVRMDLIGHQGNVNSLAFAADNQTLVSGSTDTTALVWDVTGRSTLPPRTKAPDAAEMDQLWAHLGDPDAAKAFHAIRTLTVYPELVLPRIKESLKPIKQADSESVVALIHDLDSNTFTVRDKAATDLARLGDATTAALRQALEKAPSAEVRRQVEQLLSKIDEQTQSSEGLRELRILETLEWIATDEARQILRNLASGAKEARRTEEAKAALKRLAPPQSGP
jgi:hypothetical protein